MAQPHTPAPTEKRSIGAFTEIAVTAGMLAFVAYFLFSIQGLRFQARVFPTAVLSVCALLLLITFISAAAKLARNEASAPSATEAGDGDLAPLYKSFLVPVVLIGASFAINLLGFYVAIPIVAALLFWVAGCRPWWLSVVLSLPTTGLVWLIFDLLVGVALPR